MGAPGRRSRHGRALVTAYGPDAFGPDKSFRCRAGKCGRHHGLGYPERAVVRWRLYRRHRHVLARHSGHDDRPRRVPAVLTCRSRPSWAPASSSPTTSGPAHRDAHRWSFRRGGLPRTPPFQEQGLVVASGLLGGESIVGVILAFVSVGLEPAGGRLSDCSVAT